MGESSTGRALASVHAQAQPLRNVIVISGVSPFSAALNRAVERVETPFFVQVDADMVLDPGCVQRLRAATSRQIGIAAGLLRDPLMGEVGAVKLFRTACFDTVQLRNTVATDVDFYREIADLGWLTVYVLAEPHPGRTRTLGEHRPTYSDSYTYATYYLLGAKHWQLRDRTSLRWRVRQLRSSKHPLAPLARMALGHGLFSDETRDVAKHSVRLQPQILRGFDRPDATSELSPANGSSEELSLAPEIGCQLFFDRGRQLGAASGYAEARRWLRRLGRARDHGDLWALEAALAHGFLSAAEGTGSSAAPWERLRELS